MRYSVSPRPDTSTSCGDEPLRGPGSTGHPVRRSTFSRILGPLGCGDMRVLIRKGWSAPDAGRTRNQRHDTSTLSSARRAAAPRYFLVQYPCKKCPRQEKTSKINGDLSLGK